MPLHHATGVSAHLSAASLLQSTTHASTVFNTGSAESKSDAARIAEQLSLGSPLSERLVLDKGDGAVCLIGGHRTPLHVVHARLDTWKDSFTGKNALAQRLGPSCEYPTSSGSSPDSFSTLSPDRDASININLASTSDQDGHVKLPGSSGNITNKAPKGKDPNFRALVLNVQLSAKSFFQSSSRDINIQVFYNGEFTGHSFNRWSHTSLCKRGATVDTVCNNIFAGRRVQQQIERPWVVPVRIPPFKGDLDGSTYQQSISPRARWDSINHKLLQEAISRGLADNGLQSPVAEYLNSLSVLEFPSTFDPASGNSRSGIGIIDVVVTIGTGGKEGPASGYICHPTRMQIPTNRTTALHHGPGTAVSTQQERSAASVALAHSQHSGSIADTHSSGYASVLSSAQIPGLTAAGAPFQSSFTANTEKIVEEDTFATPQCRSSRLSTSTTPTAYTENDMVGRKPAPTTSHTTTSETTVIDAQASMYTDSATQDDIRLPEALTALQLALRAGVSASGKLIQRLNDLKGHTATRTITTSAWAGYRPPVRIQQSTKKVRGRRRADKDPGGADNLDQARSKMHGSAMEGVKCAEHGLSPAYGRSHTRNNGKRVMTRQIKTATNRTAFVTSNDIVGSSRAYCSSNGTKSHTTSPPPKRRKLVVEQLPPHVSHWPSRPAPQVPSMSGSPWHKDNLRRIIITPHPKKKVQRIRFVVKPQDNTKVYPDASSDGETPAGTDNMQLGATPMLLRLSDSEVIDLAAPPREPLGYSGLTARAILAGNMQNWKFAMADPSSTHAGQESVVRSHAHPPLNFPPADSRPKLIQADEYKAGLGKLSQTSEKSQSRQRNDDCSNACSVNELAFTPVVKPVKSDNVMQNHKDNKEASVYPHREEQVFPAPELSDSKSVGPSFRRAISALGAAFEAKNVETKSIATKSDDPEDRFVTESDFSPLTSLNSSSPPVPGFFKQPGAPFPEAKEGLLETSPRKRSNVTERSSMEANDPTETSIERSKPIEVETKKGWKTRQAQNDMGSPKKVNEAVVQATQSIVSHCGPKTFATPSPEKKSKSGATISASCDTTPTCSPSRSIVPLTPKVSKETLYKNWKRYGIERPPHLKPAPQWSGPRTPSPKKRKGGAGMCAERKDGCEEKDTETTLKTVPRIESSSAAGGTTMHPPDQQPYMSLGCNTTQARLASARKDVKEKANRNRKKGSAKPCGPRAAVLDGIASAQAWEIPELSRASMCGYASAEICKAFLQPGGNAAGDSIPRGPDAAHTSDATEAEKMTRKRDWGQIKDTQTVPASSAHGDEHAAGGLGSPTRNSIQVQGHQIHDSAGTSSTAHTSQAAPTDLVSVAARTNDDDGGGVVEDADGSDRQIIPGLIRQVRKERPGFFAEEKVLVGFRFLVG